MNFDEFSWFPGLACGEIEIVVMERADDFADHANAFDESGISILLY